MAFYTVDALPEREIVPGFRARFIHGEGMTAAFWSADAGAELPVHRHPHEQMAQVMEGRFELTMGEETRTLGPGEVAIIPPDVPHGGRAATDCRLMDLFHPVREDYR
ncbi:MAG: cupin domain-containing protein [Desulfococcaceae bacterium]